jgi:hypothetical protein
MGDFSDYVMGWQCHRCGACYSPSTPSCSRCTGEPVVPWQPKVPPEITEQQQRQLAMKCHSEDHSWGTCPGGFGSPTATYCMKCGIEKP